MEDQDQLPLLFRGAKDYKDDPHALEMAQATFNEQGLYRSICRLAARWHEQSKRPARIIDLCAATGLCSLSVSRSIPTASVTLVDSDRRALEHASRRTSSIPTKTFSKDASKFRTKFRYDLVLANSAYHHIPDARKVAFLRAARALVDTDGAILLGDHFLPPYRTPKEFRTSVEWFYGHLVTELEHRKEMTEAVNVIRRSALHCWLGEYEYKVNWAVFASHCAAAGLQIERFYQVWGPKGRASTPVGTFAVLLRPRGHPALGDGDAL